MATMAETGLSRTQRRLRQQRADDVSAALTHGPTKRLLGTIFDMCGMYNPSPSHPTDMAVAAGRRAVGIDLRALLDQIDPYAYVAIAAEAVKAQDELRRQAPRPREDDDNDDAI